MTTPHNSASDDLKGFKETIDEIQSRIPNVSRAVLQSVYLQALRESRAESAEEIKRITKIANQNARSCDGLSEEIDRLRTQLYQCNQLKEADNVALKQSQEKIKKLRELLTRGEFFIRQWGAVSTGKDGCQEWISDYNALLSGDKGE
jgi:chromosome segregation ATPase